MATLEKNRLVLRVAYAGAPLAGKTESIRMLLRLLRGKDGDKHVFSPGEARGRTIFFDWADYEAGTFQGNPIRCQITSVPGQAVLSARREVLVKAADAVILVIDSRPEGLEEARRSYLEMSPWLAEADRDLEVRVILQCNKQDLDGSLSPEVLRSKLGLLAGRPSYGTSATTGKGLRPAFIAAVREALNRARALTDRGLIRFGKPEIDSGQELLERLQRDAVATDASVDARGAAPPEKATPPPPPAAPVAVTPEPLPPRRPSVPAAPRVVPSPAPRVAASPVLAAPPRGAEPSAPEPLRPAVMPASAWRSQRPNGVQAGALAVPALVDAPARASAPPTAAAPTAPTAGALPPTAPTAGALPPTAPTAGALPPTAPTAGALPPTVQTQPDVATPCPVEPEPHASPPPPTAATPKSRPAVMPASAYRALSAGTPALQEPRTVVTSIVARGGEGAPEAHPAPAGDAPVIAQKAAAAPATASAPDTVRSERAPAPAAAPAQRESTPAAVTTAERAPPSSSWRLRTRPAVMPAAAFRAQFGDAAAAPIRGSPAAAPWPGVEPASDAPRLPAPGLPDAHVCPVAIWRPLEPQMSASARAAADPRGGWHGEPVPGWYAHTIDSEADLAAARRLYDVAVSRYSALHRYLSRDRCLALTKDVGRWWVWQVVRKVPTLSSRFNDWPRAGDSPEGCAELLLDCATSFWRALQALRQAPEALPVAFEKVAPQDGGFVYAGLLPRGITPPSSFLEEDADFEDVLRKKVAVRPPPLAHIPAVLEELRRRAAGRLSAPVLEMICSVLIGH